ncbi:tRNA guanosine-2'-O-methyltransferase [Cucurbitaria berberidis CBS 394.84]|uniref:tRNA (guanine(10)-N(2))-methyltransferase n=1 Tax=Cucurbitaria berberidis CBS 394.84 TaxID=1168544 RepID=A0A9P4G8N4_9PLEO|nr:tRNA guanosine-2'-O-methyltransferase [Cucurbitaria berberidis CBS 394.84]KAF1840927.1 tRNA guanosine-2'-O-methyltransferase [Cucurbitaria berberidis CBS 394.84]
MPIYLIRLAQVHESFRKVELQALADLAGVSLQFIKYDDNSPYCIVNLPSDSAARKVITRSILAQGIYELWGEGSTYDTLHDSIHDLSASKWSKYQTASFRFTVEGYQGGKSAADQRTIIDSFSYIALKGQPRMRDPDVAFRVFEAYDLNVSEPKYFYFGRFIAESCRNEAKKTYDLKKRHYISTTSMDAELTLLTANIAHVAPGKLFYDPFMGTGGFPIACAHFGAVVFGSDIDGRTIRGLGGSARRGQTGKMDVVGNFKQYSLESSYLGSFVSDLTNTPLRILPIDEDYTKGYLDGIVCDPPYGIREGLKVLGSRQQLLDTERQSHQDQYMLPGYIPPKKPYSFTALLDDILAFAVATLVADGRLSMWMPTANDEDIELIIPNHPCLELESVCVQAFNKWSRRLLTYRRLRESEVPEGALEAVKRDYEQGTRASDLNDFRRKYFQGFKEFESMKKEFIRMKAGPPRELDAEVPKR